jgi:hypothetical protein
MEVADIRRHVLHTLDRARRRATEHREQVERAERAFQTVLPLGVAVWRHAAGALRAEGHPFALHTPAGALRLAPERAPADFIEIALDTAQHPPAVVLRTRLTRGRHVVDGEVIVGEGPGIGELDEERFLSILLEALGPFVER